MKRGTDGGRSAEDAVRAALRGLEDPRGYRVGVRALGLEGPLAGVGFGVREDEAATDEVATSDQADTLEGRIATVLGLAAARRGEIGDYGIGPGATALLPTPPPPGG
jgi:hypothetical protein